jgi:hypothetical protein
VRVSETQFPELHRHLVAACRKLDIADVPEVYVSHEVEGNARAYSVFGGRSVVVINAGLVPSHWEKGLEWIAFAKKTHATWGDVARRNNIRVQ